MNWFWLRSLVVVLGCTFAALIVYTITAGWFWPALTAAACAILAVLYDSNQAQRMLTWLRQGGWQEAPRVFGIWGDVGYTAARRLRDNEGSLREAEQRLEDFLQALQASPNGVILLNVANQINWLNRTAREHLGLDPERDLGQHITHLVRNPEFNKLMFADQIDGPVLIELVNKGRVRTIGIEKFAYGANRTLILTRDWTEQQMNERMRRDFVANVSHEMRTPLTVLLGFAEVLQEMPLDQEQQKQYIGLMRVQAQRMQSLVQDLLRLANLEGSPAPAPDAWVDVAVLMTQCEQEARGLSAGQHEIHVTWDNAQLAGSDKELLSAFSNLMSNAIRYSPAGSQIKARFTVYKDEQGQARGAEFEVKDNGPGIASEHIPRLTERFYRVDRGRSRETGGTGLGLSIVKHVLLRHEATLNIQSEVGKGSMFTIHFIAHRVRVPKTTSQ